jgi:hypothetical protein
VLPVLRSPCVSPHRLYFMERVVGNAHVNNYKAKLERKASRENGGGKGNGDHLENVYESAEHLAGSLPGLGMRVSVSKAELTELKDKEK